MKLLSVMVREQAAITIAGGVLTAVATATLAWSTNPFELSAVRVREIIATTVLSLFFGLLASVLVAVLTDLYKELSQARNELTASTNLLKEINATWSAERGLTGYGEYKPFMKFLMLEEVANANIQGVDPVNEARFYYYLTKALRLPGCNSWRGIHEGSIKKLGYNAQHAHSTSAEEKNEDRMANAYFQQLNEAVQVQKVDAKRIIILNETEEDELENPEIMEAFWKATGRHVESYVILKKAAEQLAPSPGKLDDAALFNGKFFLQHNRLSTVMHIALLGQRRSNKQLDWTMEMFAALQGPGKELFTLITGPRVKGQSHKATEVPAQPTNSSSSPDTT